MIPARKRAILRNPSPNREQERHKRRNRDREREEEQKSRERARLEKLAERERDEELESKKEQYLGSKKPKNRVIMPSEKFRFSFDGENTEDTSRNMNSLYQNPHEARLLFGRGFCAGMHRREPQRLKEEAADLYDTFDMRVDHHWSEESRRNDRGIGEFLEKISTYPIRDPRFLGP